MIGLSTGRGRIDVRPCPVCSHALFFNRKIGTEILGPISNPSFRSPPIFVLSNDFGGSSILGFYRTGESFVPNSQKLSVRVKHTSGRVPRLSDRVENLSGKREIESDRLTGLSGRPEALSDWPKHPIRPGKTLYC